VVVWLSKELSATRRHVELCRTQSRIISFPNASSGSPSSLLPASKDVTLCPFSTPPGPTALLRKSHNGPRS